MKSLIRSYTAVLTLTLSLAAGVSAGVAPARRAAEAPLLTPAVRKAMEKVQAEGIREHVRQLADDRLQGRDTGSPGADLAADYIAAQFKQLRLKPGGDEGSYFQKVPFVRSRMDFEASHLVLHTPGDETTLQLGKDLLVNGPVRTEASLRAPLVFAGYGITAPEFKHDDYAGLDVKGKLVVLLSGEPVSKNPGIFDGEKDTKHAGGGSKILLARSKGAVGVITLLTEDQAGRFPWALVRNGQTTQTVTLAGASRPGFPALVARKEGAERLLAGAPVGWEALNQQVRDGEVKPFALRAEGALTLRMERTPFTSPNVAGLLPGSDAELRKQVVIYTAHYDHVGTRGGEGDTIFNGAWDNASGTAEVLEIARAYAALKPAPKRSVLFLLVTGEEKGLLGSRYYTQHPLIPIEETAANINLDMTDIFGIPKEFVPQGAERSSLRQSCEAVAREMGMKIGKDPTPELNVFVRSDQFSFVEVGVPSLFLRWASEYEDVDAAAARESAKQKLASIYHKVTDNYDPSWSWEGMRRHAQVGFLIGLHVANGPTLPTWNAGDEFNKPRRSRPSDQ